MKRVVGLTMALALVLGVYIGMNHGDKVVAAMNGVKTEFHIAYVDKMLGADGGVPTAADAGPTDEVKESDN